MKKVIKSLCEIGNFSAAYSLNNRRYEEGLINKKEYEENDDFIFEYKTTEKKPMTIENKSQEVAEKTKKTMSAAERKAKSRAEAKKKGGDVLGGITLTSKAADQLSALCLEWNMNKTEVINKLLEEQEQRQLL